jgi:ankyrin repeat protein
MQAINIPIFPKYGYKFGSGEMINLISDRLKCIHLLLENGADVNAVNKFGRTAIMGAAYTGCTEFVKVLLRYNADVTITCKKGKTVFDYAKSRDVQKILI